MNIKNFLSEFVDNDSFIRLWSGDFALTDPAESYKFHKMACLDGKNVIKIRNVNIEDDKNTINVFIDDMPIEVKHGLKYLIESNLKSFEVFVPREFLMD